LYGKFKATILYFKTEFIFATNHPATGLKEFLDPQNFKVARFKKQEACKMNLQKYSCKMLQQKFPSNSANSN